MLKQPQDAGWATLQLEHRGQVRCDTGTVVAGRIVGAYGGWHRSGVCSCAFWVFGSVRRAVGSAFQRSCERARVRGGGRFPLSSTETVGGEVAERFP
jgi:hypothetical protein